MSSAVNIRLSVIVPVYQGIATLPECLHAIKRSLPQDAELIVVDDGSTDGSAAAAGRFAHCVIRRMTNGGQIAARWSGIQASRGELLLFVDADVVLADDTIERILQHFSKHPDTAAVTGRIGLPTRLHTIGGRYKAIYMNSIFAQMPDRCTFLYGAVHAVRRSSYRRVSTEFQGVEDNVLGLLLHRSGERVELLKALQVEHLKEYSPVELLKNDFGVARKWALIFWLTQGWRQAAGRGFLHSPRSQLCAIAVLGGGAAAAAAGSPAAAVLLLWPVFNRRLLSSLYRAEGARFALLGAGITLADQFTQGLGIIAGSLQYWRRCRSNGSRTPFVLEACEAERPTPAEPAAIRG